jgi:uncharacterized protein YgiM (DUF1202 family)
VPTAPPAQVTVSLSASGNYLNVRSGPGTGYSKIDSIRHGTAVTILGESGGWLKIGYSGKTGWVYASYIRRGGGSSPSAPPTTAAPTAPPSEPQGKPGTVLNTYAGHLNLRTGPGTGYPRIAQMQPGDALTILEKLSSGWYKVVWKGQMGYCFGKSYVRENSTSGGSTGATGTGTVTASALNVRSGPGTGYARIGTLAKGSVVTILGTQSGWYKIQYGSRTGYVSTGYVSPGSTGVPAAPVNAGRSGTVTLSSINVRSGPSGSAPLIGTLKQGTVVTVLDTSRLYYKIAYGSGTAYVYGDFIKLS